jgi:hypothetical protein
MPQARQLYAPTHYASKLTEADIPVIRQRAASGDTKNAIARDYGVSPMAILQVLQGATWRHVHSVVQCPPPINLPAPDQHDPAALKTRH